MTRSPLISSAGLRLWRGHRQRVDRRAGGPDQPVTPAGARKVFTYAGVVAATRDEVFPQLCPVLEYDWYDGWSAALEYTESGVAELGCAFRTSLNIGERWLCTRYEPPEAIQYTVWVKQGWMVLDIRLADRGDGTTEVRWQRTFTATRPLGRRIIGRMTPEVVEGEMAGVHGMLARYLESRD